MYQKKKRKILFRDGGFVHNTNNNGTTVFVFVAKAETIKVIYKSNANILFYKNWSQFCKYT